PGHVVAAMDGGERSQEVLFGEQVAVEEDRSESERFAGVPLKTESALDGDFRDDAVRNEKLADSRHCGILLLAKAGLASLFPARTGSCCPAGWRLRLRSSGCARCPACDA